MTDYLNLTENTPKLKVGPDPLFSPLAAGPPCTSVIPRGRRIKRSVKKCSVARRSPRRRPPPEAGLCLSYGGSACSRPYAQGRQPSPSGRDGRLRPGTSPSRCGRPRSGATGQRRRTQSGWPWMSLISAAPSSSSSSRNSSTGPTTTVAIRPSARKRSATRWTSSLVMARISRANRSQ